MGRLRGCSASPVADDNGAPSRITSHMHQHICPHCQQAAVSNLAVRWSSREIPAKCRDCGQLSHVIASTSSGIWVLGVVFLTATGFAALVTESSWIGLAGLALVVAHNVWAWQRAELWPISPTSAATAHKVGWLAALTTWVVALFAN